MVDKKIINVLVAEDNEINQRLISTILKKLEVTFDIVNDGAECVEYALKNSYDIIFMDIQMPNMNGYEATKIIRQKNMSIPIISISANSFEDDVKKGKDIGMSDYITKPYSKNEIENKINQWVKK
ncbi:MAG TPA: response regulator [Spirochaetota bacterium]|nr:response regulator [Spirochaetota bacterium]